MGCFLSKGVAGGFGMLVGLGMIGLGLNSCGETGRHWEQWSSSISLCSSLALLPPPEDGGFPVESSLFQAFQLPPELSLRAAAVRALLLNPNELHWVWGHRCAHRVSSWIPFSQEPAPGSEESRMEGKVLGWIFCVRVREKFSLLL